MSQGPTRMIRATATMNAMTARKIASPSSTRGMSSQSHQCESRSLPRTSGPLAFPAFVPAAEQRPVVEAATDPFDVDVPIDAAASRDGGRTTLRQSALRFSMGTYERSVGPV